MGEQATRGRGGRWLGIVARLVIAATIAGAAALVVLALRDSAGAGALADLPDPTPVHAAPVRRETGYHEARPFVGLLEPAREAALGFERAGKIVAVLAREGDAVAKGAPLARLDVAALDNERARLEATRAAQAAVAELARLTDARQSGLADNAVSGQRRDEARLALARAEAELAATDAAIAGIDIAIAKSVLLAPFAGRVAERRVDEGTIVAEGAPVLALMETAAPRARIGLAPDVAAEMAPGRSYPIEHRGRSLPATLAALRPDLDPGSRTVVALFDLDPAPGLVFGDVVTYVAAAWRPEPGYWLPLSALSEAERGLWSVLTVTPTAEGERVAREAVRVIAVDGERVYVAGAIPEDAAVVRSGVHRVIPGQAVRVAAGGE